MQLCIPSGYTLRIASDLSSWTYSPQTTTRILLIVEWDSSELRSSPMRKNGKVEGWKRGRMRGWNALSGCRQTATTGPGDVGRQSLPRIPCADKDPTLEAC